MKKLLQLLCIGTLVLFAAQQVTAVTAQETVNVTVTIVGTGTSTDTDATGSSISPVAPVSKGSTKKGTAVTTGQGTAV
ncbi:MAG: hypothetical protein WBM35_09395, partial [Candidatus Electrothrix sp.]